MNIRLTIPQNSMHFFYWYSVDIILLYTRFVFGLHEMWCISVKLCYCIWHVFLCFEIFFFVFFVFTHFITNSTTLSVISVDLIHVGDRPAEPLHGCLQFLWLKHSWGSVHQVDLMTGWLSTNARIECIFLHGISQELLKSWIWNFVCEGHMVWGWCPSVLNLKNYQ